MKHIFKQTSSIVVGLLMCTACNNWLDIQPSDRIAEDRVFSQVSGFWGALNGVYTELLSSNLYGGFLTVQGVEVMAQRYNVSQNQETFYNLSQYAFTQEQVKLRLESYWNEAYKQILECNNILENAEVRHGEVLNDKQYNLIRAEALALRGFLHFDLLRMFGPLPTQLDSKAIPYKETISVSAPGMLTGNEVIEKVLTDLAEAETLYPAVTRAAATDYSNPDRSFSSEVLFSLLNENKEDLYNTYFNSSNASSSNKLIPAAQRVQNLFGDDALSDYRYNWWEASNGIGETNLLMNVRLRKIADTDLVYGKLMPLIRVSEMYLIAAECATEEQTQYDYLNAHRLRRGNQVQVTTGLEGELAKEYSKEFLCEGQLWFYYKRTNTAKIQSGSSNTNITMSNAKYVPNLPDSEIKYRN